MSVTSSDLKSMLNRVRKPDAPVAAGAMEPKKPAASPPNPPRPEVAAAPAVGGAVAVQAEGTPPAVELLYQVPQEDDDCGGAGTDVGSVLGEIVKDEELMTRILGILYRAKKKSPNGGAVAIMPMEKELGIARESATFVLNYMKTKQIIVADDKSRNLITVEGIDFLRAQLSKIVI